MINVNKLLNAVFRYLLLTAVFATGIVTILGTSDNDDEEITINIEGNFSIEALAWGESSYWVYDRVERKIYRLDQNGDVISSFDSPVPAPNHIYSMEFNGNYIWALDNDQAGNSNIYQFDTNGVISNQFGLSGGNRYAMAFASNEIWVDRNSYSPAGVDVYDLAGGFQVNYDLPADGNIRCYGI